MAEESGDELTPHLGELILRSLFVERVLVALEERHVRVHAAARLAAQRFRHERRIHALLDRDLFDDRAERHDVVGRRQGIGIAQVDLVLTGTALMMAVLDGDAEVFQHPYRTSPEIVRCSPRNVVEVARGVDRLRSLGAV